MQQRVDELELKVRELAAYSDQNFDPNQSSYEKVIGQQQNEIVKLKAQIRAGETWQEDQELSQPSVQVNKNLAGNKRIMVRKREGTNELKAVVI